MSYRSEYLRINDPYRLNDLAVNGSISAVEDTVFVERNDELEIPDFWTSARLVVGV